MKSKLRLNASGISIKYSGFWSRRIDDEHRLIYRYEEREIQIAKCRFHYD